LSGLTDSNNYEFLDCGEGLRLERISDKYFVRQAPQAVNRKSDESFWKNPDFTYRLTGRQGAWFHDPAAELPDFEWGPLKMELRLSENGQIGVYPEQLKNWEWLSALFRRKSEPVRILNGFAYTGGSSLVCAHSLLNHPLSEICHLDASKSAVNWARINRDRSGLPEDSIRFIVDDIVRFLEREIKRERFYDGIILDPPAFGRASGGRTWVLKRDLPGLMDLCRKVLVPQPLFFLLSCHDPQLNRKDLAEILSRTLGNREGDIETLELILPSGKGHSLPNGIAARWSAF